MVVHPADIADRDGARLVLTRAAPHLPRLQHIFVDSGYRGQLIEWARAQFGWTLEVVQHAWAAVRKVWAADDPPPQKPAGFQVLPKRWIVERTFAWLSLQRRLSRDYELLPETTEALVHIAMIRLMLARLARGQ